MTEQQNREAAAQAEQEFIDRIVSGDLNALAHNLDLCIKEQADAARNEIACDHPFRVTGDMCLNCGEQDTDAVAMAARIRQLERQLEATRKLTCDNIDADMERIAELEAQLANANTYVAARDVALNQADQQYNGLIAELASREKVHAAMTKAATCAAELCDLAKKERDEANAQNARLRAALEETHSVVHQNVKENKDVQQG